MQFRIRGFPPFLSSGHISTHEGSKEVYSVCMLRDIGNAQSVLVKSAVPNITDFYTVEHVLVAGV